MNLTFERHINHALSAWNVDSSQRITLKRRSFFQQTTHYLSIKRHLKKLRLKCAAFDMDHLILLKDDEDFEKLLRLCLGIEPAELKAELKKDYIDVTKAFVIRVRDAFPEMANDAIFQALRNIWIMTLIQYISGQKVCLTDAMYAYSMLYPLTDNILDDSTLEPSEKKFFLNQLGKRLKNKSVSPSTTHEAQVFKMIELIENQYPRDSFHEVYESILCIHDAQKNSLLQQSSPLSETELLRLSFEKGAASVIADGFLVLGTISEPLFAFLTQYGIVLQLADDLQDLQEDLQCGHLTIFNSTTDPNHRMLHTQKLMNLSEKVLNQLPCEDEKIKPLIFRLLLQSMSFLISDAIFTHNRFFPRSFNKEMSQNHITGFKSHLKIKKYAKKQYGHLPF